MNRKTSVYHYGGTLRQSYFFIIGVWSAVTVRCLLCIFISSHLHNNMYCKYINRSLFEWRKWYEGRIWTTIQERSWGTNSSSLFKRKLIWIVCKWRYMESRNSVCDHFFAVEDEKGIRRPSPTSSQAGERASETLSCFEAHVLDCTFLFVWNCAKQNWP